MPAPVTKAVIPAAGLGTRFLPATKAMPKEMLPIGTKPAIQYVVEEVVASGIDDILIITGRGKRAIEDHFDHSVELEQILAARGEKEKLAEIKNIAEMASIHYIRQREPLGLGHAVYAARHHTGDKTFALLLGDDVVFSKTPAIKQLMEIYARHKKTVVAVERLPREKLHNYGVVEIKKRLSDSPPTYELCGIVEKPEPGEEPGDLAVLGRYILTPAIYTHISKTPPDQRGEIQLTHAIDMLIKEEGAVAVEIEGKRYDIGTPEGWREANSFLR